MHLQPSINGFERHGWLPGRKVEYNTIKVDLTGLKDGN